MANVQTEVKKVHFTIEDDLTTCNVFYKSSEPGNPFWGGGWVHKIFGKSKSIVDFMNEEIANYVSWDKGYYGLPDKTLPHVPSDSGYADGDL